MEVSARGSHWLRALEGAPPALPEFETFPEKGGKELKVSCRANYQHEDCLWKLQFEEDAEALSPPAIREQMARQLRNGAPA